MFDLVHLMPHGVCFEWRPELLLAHAVSDSLIALSYGAIPLSIFYITRQKPVLKVGRIYLLFILFIVACGLGHILDVWVLWFPAYYLQAGIKMFTAAISVYTTYSVWRLIPTILRLPTVDEFEAKNKALQDEINAHLATEENLKRQRNFADQLQNTINTFALVSVTDVDGTIIYANEKFCEVSGYSMHELMGKNHRIINSGYHLSLIQI